MIRAQPMDAVVLIGGCDKTVPAQLMGAASANIPTIQLITGAMLTGLHRGERVGACTDCRRYWGKYRAGEIDAEETAEVNNQFVASVGTCSVMGTASTMACIAEGLGMTMPGGASPPAVTADRIRIAELTGAQAVQMARDRLTIDKILTPAAFENAMRVLLAIGGSTNGIGHLAAIAGRMGLDIDMQALDRMGRETPVLLDLKPSGQHYMEDFHRCGGMATLLRELKPLLRLEALTVTGRTLGDSDDLDVSAQDVLVLKNIGPKGASMPEVGYIPIPRTLARTGVKDIVRISDGRMSGTAFGTIVLHVTPEAAVGGPLAHVKNGDRIRLSVKNREIALLVSDEVLAQRARDNPVVQPSTARGYHKLFLQAVTQDDQGVDFDFLRAARTVGKTPALIDLVAGKHTPCCTTVRLNGSGEATGPARRPIPMATAGSTARTSGANLPPTTAPVRTARARATPRCCAFAPVMA